MLLLSTTRKPHNELAITRLDCYARMNTSILELPTELKVASQTKSMLSYPHSTNFYTYMLAHKPCSNYFSLLLSVVFYGRVDTRTHYRAQGGQSNKSMLSYPHSTHFTHICLHIDRIATISTARIVNSLLLSVVFYGGVDTRTC